MVQLTDTTADTRLITILKGLKKPGILVNTVIGLFFYRPKTYQTLIFATQENIKPQIATTIENDNFAYVPTFSFVYENTKMRNSLTIGFIENLVLFLTELAH